MNQRLISWIGTVAGVCVLLGVLSSLLWAWVTPLPAYLVDADFHASLGERGQVEVFAADAWFVLIGLAVGLAIGWLNWAWFRHLGWPVALLAVAGGLIAGGTCAGIGQLLGPGPFDARLAAAHPGALVPIALDLHAPSALAFWALAAVSPTLFLASIGPELAEPDAEAATDEAEAGASAEPALDSGPGASTPT